MHIRELFPDVISEDLDYEYKTVLTPDKPIKWAKTIVGYANGKGGIMFVGVSNEGEAFGISLDEIDKTKNLIATINDSHIFPHARVMLLSVAGFETLNIGKYKEKQDYTKICRKNRIEFKLMDGISVNFFVGMPFFSFNKPSEYF